MKANEAPEKLYFGESDKGILDIYSNRESNDEIEYTRTDAFIEKASEFFDEHLYEYIDVKNNKCTTFIYIDSDKLKEDFKNYMKGV
jgi:hypothetical protein